MIQEPLLLTQDPSVASKQLGLTYPEHEAYLVKHPPLPLDMHVLNQVEQLVYYGAFEHVWFSHAVLAEFTVQLEFTLEHLSWVYVPD